jgi:alpha-tubulin suppressor-like RCC1 family protein
MISTLGYYHTLVLASNNCVYSFGSNQYGQLGLSLAYTDSVKEPKQIKYFQDKIITSIACG